MAVSGEDVEQTVEESVDEENEADEERTQQYSRRAAPLIQQQAALTDPQTPPPRPRAATWRVTSKKVKLAHTRLPIVGFRS